MTLSTHVLDARTGRPAAGVAVRVEDSTGAVRGEGRTDADGRLINLPALSTGAYRLIFATGPYFAAQDVPTFYPQVAIDFEITEPATHHHVPLLLSPFAYSTYRGS